MLADSVSHSRSRVTHTVSRMETAGLVARDACVSDGRGVEAVLTDQGRRGARERRAHPRGRRTPVPRRPGRRRRLRGRRPGLRRGHRPADRGQPGDGHPLSGLLRPADMLAAMTAWHRHNLDPVHTVYPLGDALRHPGAYGAACETVRAFAMDEVLPVANELDPQKGEIPDVACWTGWPSSGYFGITDPRGRGRPRARRLRVLHGHRGAGPGLDERRPASSPARSGIGHGSRRRRPPARAAAAQRRAATGSARSRSPSPTPAPTWPASPARAVRDGRRVGGHRAQALVRQRPGRRLHPGARARRATRREGESRSAGCSTCSW